MNAQDSEDLVRVGAGTVMGEFMRQYWVPAALSSEVEADGAPLRLLLLGEKLIAFRDSSGRVGVMDQRCPHRCASLFLGRNEENGIRCVYHGWKFDVTGRCVDMPSVPPELHFKDKVHAKAYRTAERGGLIWVYMGSRADPPPLPPIEATMLPASELKYEMSQRECNWLQALEGDIDTAHFGFLHAGHLDPDELEEGHAVYYAVLDRAPRFEVAEKPWGISYGAPRALDSSRNHWKTTHFMFPFYTMTPGSEFSHYVHIRVWVPMDDTHTMNFFLKWKGVRGYADKPLKNGEDLVPKLAFDYLPNTTDWYGRFRLRQNADNDWEIDREAQQRGESFTGICNIALQDQAMTESMGPIVDHGCEHLAATDMVVTRTRRRLLEEARAFRDGKRTPPGVDNSEIYANLRSGFYIAPAGMKWWEAYEAARDKAVHADVQEDQVPARGEQA